MDLGLMVSKLSGKRQRQDDVGRNKKLKTNARNLWAVGKLGKFAGWLMPTRKAAITVHAVHANEDDDDDGDDDGDDDEDDDDDSLGRISLRNNDSIANITATIERHEGSVENTTSSHEEQQQLLQDDDEEEEDQASLKPAVIAVPTPNKSHLPKPSTTSGRMEGEELVLDIRVDSPLESSSRISSPTTTAVLSLAGGGSVNHQASPPLASRLRRRTKPPSAFNEDDNDLPADLDPRPYVPTCYAISHDGARCSMFPTKHRDYCQIHLRTKLNFGTLLDQSIVKGSDRKYWGEPGSTQCRGVSQRGTRCEYLSVAKWDLCRRHLKFPPGRFVPFAPQRASRGNKSLARSKQTSDDLTDSQEEESDSETEPDDIIDVDASSHSSASSSSVSTEASEANIKTKHSSGSDDSSTWEEPHEYDHSKDKRFTGKFTEERCNYVSITGEQCPYRTTDISDDSVYCRGHFPLMRRLQSLLDVQDGPKGSKDAESDDDDDDDDASGDEDEVNIVQTQPDEPRPYTHKEFLDMWRYCEDYCGEGTASIENTKQVRSANQSMCPEDTDGQAKAQYGRLLPRAMKTMMKNILGLTRDDIFLDIGHGIGNTCLQAALTAGCESRGIEVVFSRNSIAGVFRDRMLARHKLNSKTRVIGDVFLRHGRLEDQIHREFLTKGVTKAFVNNFNGVFAERSVKLNTHWFLDDYVSGIFAMLVPGAIMVTLHPLNLGPTQDEANAIRRKHDLKESPKASFFTVEYVLLGRACDTVKWNKHSGNAKNIYVYKYTRLSQGPDAGNNAVFLCCNPSCPDAKDCTPIPATTINDEGRCVINQCKCKFTAKNLRRQSKKAYNE